MDLDDGELRAERRAVDAVLSPALWRTVAEGDAEAARTACSAGLSPDMTGIVTKDGINLVAVPFYAAGEVRRATPPTAALSGGRAAVATALSEFGTGLPRPPVRRDEDADDRYEAVLLSEAMLRHAPASDFSHVHEAISRGDVAMLGRLLRGGTPVPENAAEGSPLRHAVEIGAGADVFVELLSAMHDPDAADADGTVPSALAAEKGMHEAVSLFDQARKFHACNPGRRPPSAPVAHDPETEAWKSAIAADRRAVADVGTTMARRRLMDASGQFPSKAAVTDVRSSELAVAADAGDAAAVARLIALGVDPSAPVVADAIADASARHRSVARVVGACRPSEDCGKRHDAMSVAYAVEQAGYLPAGPMTPLAVACATCDLSLITRRLQYDRGDTDLLTRALLFGFGRNVVRFPVSAVKALVGAGADPDMAVGRDTVRNLAAECGRRDVLTALDAISASTPS